MFKSRFFRARYFMPLYLAGGTSGAMASIFSTIRRRVDEAQDARRQKPDQALSTFGRRTDASASEWRGRVDETSR